MSEDEAEDVVALIYEARNWLRPGPCSSVTEACAGADAEWREALAALEKAIAIMEGCDE